MKYKLLPCALPHRAHTLAGALGTPASILWQRHIGKEKCLEGRKGYSRKLLPKRGCHNAPNTFARGWCFGAEDKLSWHWHFRHWQQQRHVTEKRIWGFSISNLSNGRVRKGLGNVGVKGRIEFPSSDILSLARVYVSGVKCEIYVSLPSSGHFRMMVVDGCEGMPMREHSQMRVKITGKRQNVYLFFCLESNCSVCVGKGLKQGHKELVLVWCFLLADCQSQLYLYMFAYVAIIV